MLITPGLRFAPWLFGLSDSSGAGVTIRDEGATLAAELARMVDVESRAVEQAIEAQDQRYVPSRRNRVSTLSTVAWLTALLSSMPATERRNWLLDSADARPSRLERLLAGDL